MVNNTVNLLDNVKRAKAELEYVEKVLFGYEYTGMVEKTGCDCTAMVDKKILHDFFYDVIYSGYYNNDVFDAGSVVFALKKDYKYLYILRLDEDESVRLLFTNYLYEGDLSICDSFKLNDVKDMGYSHDDLEDKLLFIFEQVQEIIVELKTNVISDRIYSLNNDLFEILEVLDEVNPQYDEPESFMHEIVDLADNIRSEALKLEDIEWQEFKGYDL